MDKPIIDYPCDWEYRLIGLSEQVLRAAVVSLVPSEHKLEPSKESKKGKYVSYCLTVQVIDEGHRHRLFEALKVHVDIQFVL